MKLILTFFWLISINFTSFSQCLTSYQKLGPDKYVQSLSSNNDWSIDVHDNLAVVGVPYSDSLQNDAGLAFVYEFTGDQWERIAVLRPSNPMPSLQFGYLVKMVENTIVITGITNSLSIFPSIGGMYVFEKPAEGWRDMPETALLHIEGSDTWQGFGRFAVINQEGSTVSTFYQNKIYLFPKPDGGWQNSSSPTILDLSDSELIVEDISLDKNILAVGLTKLSDGKVIIYKSIAPDWSQLEKVNELSRYSDFYYAFGTRIKLHDNHLLVSSMSYGSDTVFLYQTTNDWTTIASETALTSSTAAMNGGFHHLTMDMDDNTILINRFNLDHSKAVISYYTKYSGEWNNDLERNLSLPIKYYQIPKAAVSRSHLIFSGKLALEDTISQVYFYEKTGNDIVNIQKLIFQEMNSSGSRYGGNVVLHQNIAAIFSSRNWNSSTPNAGVIELYEKQPSGQWDFLTNIPFDDADRNMNFGSVITFYNDYIAVGAPVYYEENKSLTTGVVFVYKRKGDSWKNVELVAKLRPSDWEIAGEDGNGINLNFGVSIVMDENIIIVGGPGKDGGIHTNQDYGQIYVFEKKDDEEWQSGYETAILRVENPFPNTRLGENISFSDNTIFCSAKWSNRIHTGFLYIYERPESGWVNTTETHTISFHLPNNNNYGFISGDLVIADDLLFIGNPSAPIDGKTGAGTILVFKKSETGWKNGEIVSKIRLKNPKTYDYTGSVLSIKDNIMLIGAPLLMDDPSTIPESERRGSVTVIQSMDHLWVETIELLKLNGEKTSPIDGFGYKVSNNEVDIVVGAIYDDFTTGYQSGAAYLISMPPTVQLLEPVCLSAESVPINAYPGGGVWSGPGIVDGTENRFYPILAGIGEHELTYTTDNCYYPGKMKITVYPDVEINFISPDDPVICGKDTIKIEADPHDGATYTWHYHPDKYAEIESTETEFPLINIYQEGYYILEVKKNGCTSISDTVEVRKLENNIVFDPLPIICSDQQSIELSVEPSGGIWKNPAISGNKLNPAQLGQGLHDLIYEINLENTCLFSDTLLVNIDLLGPLDLDLADELCDAKGTALNVTPFQNTKYVLEQNVQNSFTTYQEDSLGIFYLKDAGKYRVVAYKHSCSVTSEEVEFTPQLDLEMKIDHPEVQFCKDSGFDLMAEEDITVSYSWEQFVNDSWKVVSEGVNNATYLVTQEGKYRVKASKNHCHYTSPEYDFISYPPDTIFIPNLVTANGDGNNDQFEVLVENAEILDLTIFNRLGDKIFHASDYDNTWPATQLPSGIYYYQIVFKTPCNQSPRPLVGWVHLLN